MQFSSLKLAFAQELGHQGIFRLSRFIHSLSPEALAAKVATLPNVELKPLPLLAAAKI